ncbi:MAG: hypothetical protein ACRED5_10285 [Propylenella sp.]
MPMISLSRLSRSRVLRPFSGAAGDTVTFVAIAWNSFSWASSLGPVLEVSARVGLVKDAGLFFLLRSIQYFGKFLLSLLSASCHQFASRKFP